MQTQHQHQLLNYQRGELLLAQSDPVEPAEGTNSDRWYFEGIAATTKEPNSQYYIFKEAAMPGLVAQYKDKQPVQVMHATYGKGGLGFGMTVDAWFENQELRIKGYLMRNKTTPLGPYGDTNELIEAVMDGTAGMLSVGVLIPDGRCSICHQKYERWYPKCGHYKGEEFEVIDEATGQVTGTETALIEIYEAIAQEISIVNKGSDNNADIVDMDLQLAAMNTMVFGGFEPPADITPPQPEGVDKMALSLEAQVGTLTAEKGALEAQITAKDGELTAIKQTNATLEAQVTERDEKIVELEAKVAENETLVADGKTARAEGIKGALAEFTRLNPEDNEAELTPKLEAEKAMLEGLPLEKVLFLEGKYKEQADKLYPEGRTIKTDNGGEDKSTSVQRLRQQFFYS